MYYVYYSKARVILSLSQVGPIHFGLLRLPVSRSWIPFVLCGERQSLQLLPRHLRMDRLEGLLGHFHSRFLNHR